MRLHYHELDLSADMLQHLVIVLSAACTLRAAMMLSAWLHEVAHLLAAVALGITDGQALTPLTKANMTGICRHLRLSSEMQCQPCSL